ncbi:MAG: M13 family metallopeptidase [Myxococcaceae bacterium]
MKRSIVHPGLVSALCLCAVLPARAEAPAATPDLPLSQLPYTPVLEPAFMDRTADPCVDFYKFTCGGWQKANPIPADQSSWSVYGKWGNEVNRYLWSLLTELSKPSWKRTSGDKQLGEYFAACMDEAALEKKGATPLEPALTALAALSDPASLAKWLGEQHLSGDTNQLLFGLGSEQDASASTEFIAGLRAGGLGLPDRDDYFDKKPKGAELRERYVEHVEKMLRLLGDDEATAKKSAQLVLRLETELAKASLTRVERRDPYKVFHKMDRAKAKALAPKFDWDAYFAAVGVPDTKVLNVSQPKFFTQVGTLLGREPLANWKTYLRWQLVTAHAESLSAKFVDQDFDFYQRYLRGAQTISPRWKRCVRFVDRDLGEALGEAFVRRNFPRQTRERAKIMVAAIQAEMAKDLGSLDWMSDVTRKQALAKLNTMANKIGHPDKWRDYSSVSISRDDFFGNVTRAAHFESKRQLGKIGKPIDRGEWFTTPQTVNAFYNPQMNDMNFTAAVLQPPLFDAKLDDAPNYGNTGGTVGHELTHGFDDEGRQFDAHGNLRDWWTKKDAEAFNKRTKCVSDQFSKYTAVDDIKVNGQLTLGEDVADLGGLLLAYRAWKTVTKGQDLRPKDGLTPEQRFFVGYAQWACENTRPERQRLLARTDPHSPARYRVNGLLVNVPEFGQAFSCKPGQPMAKAPKDICRVW